MYGNTNRRDRPFLIANDMKRKEQELLLKDLCARLPYRVEAINSNGVKGAVVDINRTYSCVGILYDVAEGHVAITPITHVKPYLRPISDMTEDEKRKFDDFCVIDEDTFLGNSGGYANQARIMDEGIDYLNSIHVDHRGLIERGLAIAVTEENNPCEV